MWSCTRARWAMRISDELNRFEKGLCRVAGPFFCVKGTAFSGTGGTDCHDQFANWFRNDRVFARSAVQVRRRDEGTPPYGGMRVGTAGDHEGRPYGGGVDGLPRALCALAMTPLTRSAGCGGTHGSRPATVHFCRAGPVCPAGSAVRNRRADRGVRPYGWLQEVPACGPMWGANRALPVAEEAR